MKRLAWIGGVLCAAAIAGGCVTNRHDAAAPATGLLSKSVQLDGTTIPYAVFVPHDFDPANTWPLIVFLHGRGERGKDGVLQTKVGLYPAVQKNPERFPCLVLMPQCPIDRMWASGFDIIDATLDRTLSEYPIDRNRIYLTGLSMGGYGAWLYGAERDGTFAALLPICGGGKVSDAPRLAKTPIWAFHGAADALVNPEASRAMVEAVKQAGGTIQYTEYPGVAHNAWDLTYSNPEVIAWLLAQHK